LQVKRHVPLFGSAAGAGLGLALGLALDY